MSEKQYIEIANREDVIRFVDIMLESIASDMPLEIDFRGMKWCITYWGHEVKIPPRPAPDNRNEIIGKLNKTITELTERNKHLENENMKHIIDEVF